MRLVLAFTLGVVGGCWPGPAPFVAPTSDAPTAVRKAHAARPLGPFGVYRILNQDPFASGPSMGNLADSSTWPRSGSKWSWGFTGTSAAPVIHYLVLPGQPDEVGAELAVQAGAPSPTLPDGARMLYFGKEQAAGGFVFETVAVLGAPLLEASDLESCTIVEHAFHDGMSGQVVVTMRPWINVRFTDAGLRKLATVTAGTGLSVAFGDDALSMMWLPEWTATSWFPSDFPVEGVSEEGRRARGKALGDACTAQRDTAAIKPSSPSR